MPDRETRNADPRRRRARRLSGYLSLVLICVVATGTGDASNAARQVFIDLASADAVGTHRLESDPARADALLFVDAHCNTADVLQRQLRSHPLVRAHRGKTYVYDQRDRPLWSFPGLYMNATRREGERRRLMIGGPYATTAADDELPDRSPDLLFSFRGSRTHPLRDEVRVLLLHGLLHLAGFDHERDAGEMAARELELRQQLGLPASLIARSSGPAASGGKRKVQDDNAKRRKKRPASKRVRT